jgi:hypothetical protein
MHIGNKNDSHWIKVKKTTPDSPTSPVHPSAANSSFHAPPPLQQGLRGLSKLVPLVSISVLILFHDLKVSQSL